MNFITKKNWILEKEKKRKVKIEAAMVSETRPYLSVEFSWFYSNINVSYSLYKIHQ